jgi:hypothetical protein
VKRSEVKRSELVYIQGRGSSDYVATSYRLDGLGSFPGSVFILFSSIIYVFSSVFSAACCVLYCSCTCIVPMYMYCIGLWMFVYL